MIFLSSRFDDKGITTFTKSSKSSDLEEDDSSFTISLFFSTHYYLFPACKIRHFQQEMTSLIYLKQVFEVILSPCESLKWLWSINVQELEVYRYHKLVGCTPWRWCQLRWRLCRCRRLYLSSLHWRYAAGDLLTKPWAVGPIWTPHLE